MILKKATIALVCSFGLVACEGGGGSIGPDEFGLLPTKPLEQPEDYSYLPTPTKGGPNRVDQNPDKDAVLALGGQPSRLEGGRIFVSEQALVTAASRYGVDGNIREELATEDAQLLKTRGARLLERLSGHSDTFRAYKRYVLDAEEEAARLRGLGIKTPTPTSEPPADQN